MLSYPMKRKTPPISQSKALAMPPQIDAITGNQE